MPAELTTEGLSTQTFAEIRAEIVADLVAIFGPSINTLPSTILGQLVDIWSELESIEQQALLALWRAQDPAAAEGVALDHLAFNTGSVRKGPLPSQVEGFIETSGATTIPAGSLFRLDTDDSVWSTAAEVIAPGAGSFAARLVCTTNGPIPANAGSTWTVVTPLPSLVGFTNPDDDAEIGRNQESDEDFRRRRSVELFAQGQGPLAAITAVVSKVNGVEYVRTYHNPATQPTDGNGIPFKAFNVVVLPQPASAEVEQAIYDAIWSATGAGGEAYGTDYVGTSTDIEGVAQPVAFDVVDVVNAQIAITLTTSTSEQAVSPNLVQVVTDGIVDYAQRFWEVPGRDLTELDITGRVYDLIQSGDVTGVDAVTVALSVGATPYPGKIPIGIREIVDVDSGNITVGEA